MRVQCTFICIYYIVEDNNLRMYCRMAEGAPPPPTNFFSYSFVVYVPGVPRALQINGHRFSDIDFAAANSRSLFSAAEARQRCTITQYYGGGGGGGESVQKKLSQQCACVSSAMYAVRLVPERAGYECVHTCCPRRWWRRTKRCQRCLGGERLAVRRESNRRRRLDDVSFKVFYGTCIILVFCGDNPPKASPPPPCNHNAHKSDMALKLHT